MEFLLRISGCYCLLLIHSALWGQIACPVASEPGSLQVNQLEVNVINGMPFLQPVLEDTLGGLRLHGPEYPESGVPLASAAGAWLGGRSENGQLLLQGSTYGFEALPGPASAAVDCQALAQHFNRYWSVFAYEVENFRLDWSDGQLDQAIPINLYRWPGLGNPHSSWANGFELPADAPALAPFNDVNDDGIYDPEAGDYPAIKGDVCTWWVSHTDVTNPQWPRPRVQIGALLYSFDTDGDYLDRTLFVETTYHYLGEEPMADAFLSLWVDGDLGCLANDRVACIPDRTLAFYYQTEPDEAACPPLPLTHPVTFTGQAPTLLVDVLERPAIAPGTTLPFHAFMVMGFQTGIPFTSSSAPQNPDQFYRYQQGIWPDGVPLTLGGYDPLGDPYPYAYDYAELLEDTTGGWSMPWIDQTSSDKQSLHSFGPFSLQPGQSFRIAYALSVGPPLDDILDPAPVIEQADALQSFYDNYADEATATREPNQLQQPRIQIYPNPASPAHAIRLQSDQVQIRQVELHSAAGRLVGRYPCAGFHCQLPAEDLPAGVYLIRIRLADRSWQTHRLVLQK